MVPGSKGAIDAGDGIPDTHAATAHGSSDTTGYDEFGLDYIPGASAGESSFSADDIPG